MLYGNLTLYWVVFDHTRLRFLILWCTGMLNDGPQLKSLTKGLFKMVTHTPCAEYPNFEIVVYEGSE